VQRGGQNRTRDAHAIAAGQVSAPAVHVIIFGVTTASRCAMPTM